jgi:hypothetical protein
VLCAALVLVLTSGVLAGCVVVMQKPQLDAKQDGKQDGKPVAGVNQSRPAKLLPSKPVVPMSDEVVRSEMGDMVSMLPDQWSLVNLETNMPTQVFSVAVNTQYTAGLIYSVLRKEDTFEQTYQKEGLTGIGKISLSKRDHKMRNIKRIGDFEEVLVGTKRFCTYRYTTDNGSTLSRVAVFRSSFGNYYECTLADMTFTGRKLIAREDMDNIYLSVLATIDF